MKRLKHIFLVFIVSLGTLYSCHPKKITIENNREVIDTIAFNLNDTAKEQLILIDTLKKTGIIKILFNKNTAIIHVIYNNGLRDKIFDLGRHNNTFEQLPEVDIVMLNKNNIGIVIRNNVITLGQSEDGITIYNLNTTNTKLEELCDVSGIAQHNAEKDTALRDVTYYDYFINLSNKRLQISEYTPYKLLENTAQKYTTTIKEYPFRFDN